MKLVFSTYSRVIDLSFCLVFMPVLVLLGPAHGWATEWPLFFVLDMLWLLVCYFTVRRQNFPKLFISRRYRRIIAVSAMLVCCNWAISFYPLPRVEFVIDSMSDYQTSVRDYGVALSVWLMFFAVLCFALTISFVSELYRQSLLRKDIELQRDKAELAMFKAQISPHFLFNTLNSLYSLVVGTSDKAEKAFIMFTDLLRYTYTSVGNELVAIGQEVDYISNYIELQRLRLNEHTSVDWHTEIDDRNSLIPPMLFLTFTENCFKYGSSASHDCKISISMSLRNGIIDFRTDNAIMRHADSFRTDLPVGLANCRARLDGLFPGKYSLMTTDNNGVFSLSLTIDLN